MQWGLTALLTGDSTPGTVTFSLPFPNSVLNMQATTVNSDNLVDIVPNIASISSSGATILANNTYGSGGSNQVTIYWFAIGY